MPKPTEPNPDIQYRTAEVRALADGSEGFDGHASTNWVIDSRSPLVELNIGNGGWVNTESLRQLTTSDHASQPFDLFDIGLGDFPLLGRSHFIGNVIRIVPIDVLVNLANRLFRDPITTRQLDAAHLSTKRADFVDILPRQDRVSASPDVFSLRDRFKVIGIHAGLLLAQMIKHKAVRNRAVFDRVVHDVGVFRFVDTVNRTVAKTMQRALPNPARRVVSAILNDDFGGGRLGLHHDLQYRYGCHAGGVRSAARLSNFTTFGSIGWEV